MDKRKPQKDSTQSPIQLLRDPTVEPTDEVLAQALGDANIAYLKFANELVGHDIKLVWRYYTDGKAWLAKGLYQWTGARGGRKEMTVFWLSVWDGFFKVSVFVPEKSRADVSSLLLPDEVLRMIAEARQMGERLKFFPVVFDLRSDEIFEGLFELAEFKKRIK